MNRRTFFRTATLSTAAVATLHGKLSSPPATPMNPPPQADIADPGAAAYIANRLVDLFARMEEPNPADPGELSEAVLLVSDAGECVTVTAVLGDVTQCNSHRSRHLLGWLEAESANRFALIDPESSVNEDVPFGLMDPQQQDSRYSAYLTFVNSELRLSISNHCFGVLRGDLLATFFQCLRERCVLA